MTNGCAPNFAKIVERHRATAVLRILSSDEFNGRVNEYLLAEVLHRFALSGSVEKVRACLRRLEDIGVVVMRPVPDKDLFVVELTKEGVDVVNGRARVDGIEPHIALCPY